MKCKHSLKSQIAGIFIGVMLLALVVIGVINLFFLEGFYVREKKDVLKETFQELQGINVEDFEPSDKALKNCYEQNITWLVMDSEWSQGAAISDSGDRQADLLKARLFGYINGLEITQVHALEKSKKFVIQQSKDMRANMEYLEIYGMLENGNYAIVRTPLESIRDSVSISNKFYVYIGLIIIVISAAAIWFATGHITKPICELTAISQKMAELDFDTKYKSRHRSEIDVLGENFNKMSGQLEATISELKTANEELKRDIADKIKIDEMRKEFLDNVSHELKTPIALVQGYAEGLKENITDDPESMEFYCDVIMDEAAKMNVMVKQLLTLNQLESGADSLNIERFDLTDLIGGVIQASDILIQQKEAQVSFAGKEPVHVWADEFKIEEVVTNFFTNALNHLDENRRIEIKMDKQDKRVRVSVFNTGRPIPEADLEHIWEKFYKVDKARTREYGGSGIGLSIVKAIMDNHHQECGVNNYENGVEFWFELTCE